MPTASITVSIDTATPLHRVTSLRISIRLSPVKHVAVNMTSTGPVKSTLNGQASTADAAMTQPSDSDDEEDNALPNLYTSAGMAPPLLREVEGSER